jgi:hypothetical protein
MYKKLRTKNEEAKAKASLLKKLQKNDQIVITADGSWG